MQTSYRCPKCGGDNGHTLALCRDCQGAIDVSFARQHADYADGRAYGWGGGVIPGLAYGRALELQAQGTRAVSLAAREIGLSYHYVAGWLQGRGYRDAYTPGGKQ